MATQPVVHKPNHPNQNTQVAAPAKPAKKKRETVPENETAEQKLRRLAGKRVNRAVKMIEVCGNLSAYKPTPEQAAKIISTLKSAVLAAEARFQAKTKDSRPAFAL